MSYEIASGCLLTQGDRKYLDSEFGAVEELERIIRKKGDRKY